MRVFVSFICFLVVCDQGWTGSAKMCRWDSKLESKQGLAEGHLEWRFNVTDPDHCRQLCCASDSCDLMLLGFPADGAAQCGLVTCPFRGCTLKRSDQFRVYRRLKIVPLLDLKPKDANTTLCQLPMKVGRCRAAFPRFFYNMASQTCAAFTYGGCGGNENNFVSQEACEAACGGVTGPSPQDPGKHAAPTLPSPKKVVVSSDMCSGSPDSGPCRAAFTMFYYDQDTSMCHSFVYGGCHGNMNRHASMEECLSRCSGGGSLDSRGQLRNRWTAAFFLLLTLAGVSALLVAALIVITVRRRLPRRTSSLSDKEELLQDPDEPSQDSLSVPATTGNA